MQNSRNRPDLGPRALRLFGSRAARGELLTMLVLVAGTAALTAFVDLQGLLARWTTQDWGWLLGAPWALPALIISIALGLLVLRRMRELGAEVARRQGAELQLADLASAAAAAAAVPPAAGLAGPAPGGPAGSSAEWSWEIDADQRLTMVSAPAPASLAALARAQAPWRPGGPLADDQTWVRHRADLIRGRAFREFQFRIADADGQERHLQISGWPVQDRQGQPAGFRGTGIDVTRATVAEAQVRHLIAHDPLTDLPHRGELRERLAQALARARRGESGALLCLNLDRFSEVNDTLGPAAGDELIRACAERLRACIGAPGTVARIGGDEFAILKQRTDAPSDAEALCQQLLARLAEPFEIAGSALTMTACIGVVLIPGDGGTADDLLKHADIALRWAKGEGPGSWRRFEPDMDTEFRARTAFEADLWAAFAASQFELHYQPQLEAKTHTVIGLEALLRWRHPTQGLVQPRDFLPLAEETGLMVPLGAWVLREACARAMAWPKLRISVNLSPAQFRHRDLISLVQQTLDQTGLAPERLELEITEGALLSDTHKACETLDRLKQQGVTIAIDDFGTGYSSLSYLQKFDRIKIARSFTGALGRHEEADAMVHAIMGLGRVLGMEVCAEGVETAEQSSWLQAQGCAELQGFLFSRPLEAAEIEAFVRATAAAELEGSYQVTPAA